MAWSIKIKDFSVMEVKGPPSSDAGRRRRAEPLGPSGSTLSERRAYEQECGPAHRATVLHLDECPGGHHVAGLRDLLTMAGGAPALARLRQRGYGHRGASNHGGVEDASAVLAWRPPAHARSPILLLDGCGLGAARVVVVHRAIGRPGGVPREGDHHASGRHERPPIAGSDAPVREEPECGSAGLTAMLGLNRPGAGRDDPSKAADLEAAAVWAEAFLGLLRGAARGNAGCTWHGECPRTPKGTTRPDAKGGATPVASPRTPVVGALTLSGTRVGARPAASTFGAPRETDLQIGETMRERPRTISSSADEHELLRAVAALIRAPQRRGVRDDAAHGHDREAQAVRAKALAHFARRSRRRSIHTQS